MLPYIHTNIYSRIRTDSSAAHVCHHLFTVIESVLLYVMERLLIGSSRVSASVDCYRKCSLIDWKEKTFYGITPPWPRHKKRNKDVSFLKARPRGCWCAQILNFTRAFKCAKETREPAQIVARRPPSVPPASVMHSPPTGICLMGCCLHSPRTWCSVFNYTLHCLKV